MKSIIKKVVYTGLGFLGDGTNTVKSLGQEFAKKAGVSEVEGEKIAKILQARSSKAVKSIRKNLDAKVTEVAEALHAVIGEEIEPKKQKPAKPTKTAKKTAKNKAKATRTGGKAP